MNLTQLQDKFQLELQNLYPKEEVENLFFMLLENIGVSKIQYRMDNRSELVKESFCMEVLKGLQAGEPIQYLFGEAYFYEDYYLVNKHVLIPRGETEELVDWIVKDVPKNAFILDIGTGSGCIPISLKKNLPETTVFSVDVSKEALKIGLANEEKILGTGKVRFEQCDILKDFPDFEPTVIVSNPPYVTQEDKRKMHVNVLDNEPYLALFSNTPLQFYERITMLAREHLPEGGSLFFEINENYGKEVKEFMISNGFKQLEIRKDLNKKDRMIKGVKA